MMTSDHAIEAFKRQTILPIFLALPSLCGSKKEGKQHEPRLSLCNPAFVSFRTERTKWKKDSRLPASLHFQTLRQRVGMWGSITWSALKVSKQLDRINKKITHWFVY